MLRELFNYLANKWPEALGAHRVKPVTNLPLKSGDDRPLVNYMWINSHKTTMDMDAPGCALNLGNIKRAVDNANRYPQADFKIWIDKQLLDEYSQFVLEDFIAAFSRTKNIDVHDLHEITDYAEDSYFVPLSPGDKGFIKNEFNRTGDRNVYARADYGRILVLDHCMQEYPDRSHVIYSDIDCLDLRLKEAIPIMDKYGVCIHNLESLCVSHGYIALAAHNDAVKEHMGALKEESKKAAHRDDLGFRAFERFLYDLELPWQDVIGIKKLLPEIQTCPLNIDYIPKASFMPQSYEGRDAQMPLKNSEPS